MEITETLGLPDEPAVQIQVPETWVWELDGEAVDTYPSLEVAKLTLGWMFGKPEKFCWEEIDEGNLYKSGLSMKMKWGWQDTGFRLYRKYRAGEAITVPASLVAA